MCVYLSHYVGKPMWLSCMSPNAPHVTYRENDIIQVFKAKAAHSNKCIISEEEERTDGSASNCRTASFPSAPPEPNCLPVSHPRPYRNSEAKHPLAHYSSSHGKRSPRSQCPGLGPKWDLRP